MRRAPLAAVLAALLALVPGALVAGGCDADYQVRAPDAFASTRLIYGADGVIRREMNVELWLYPDHRRTRHYALEAFAITAGEGERAWTIDAVEFDSAEWPTVLETQDIQKRRLFVRAHWTPDATVAVRGQTAVVTLLTDEGPVDASVFLNDVAETEPCAPVSAEGALASVGVPVAWMTEGPPALAERVLGVASDGADRVWVATEIPTPPSEAIRVFVVTPTGFGAVKELASLRAALAPGTIATAAGRSAAILANVNTTPTGDWTLAVTRYDDALDVQWQHSLALGADLQPVIAASGGRVLLSLSSSDPILIDGVEVAPASIDGNRAVMLDETTGEFLAAADTRLFDLVALPDGAFATHERINGNEVFAVREADLSLRWTSPAKEDATLDVGADGSIWASSYTTITRFDAFGAVSVALPRPMSGATAALGDGSAIVAGATDVARIADGQAANVQPIGGTGVQWCDTNLSWSFAPTPSSHAFVLKSDGVALSVGRMGP